MRTIRLAGVALVTVVFVAAIVFAVWASVWQAPWEGSGTASESPATTVSTPSSKFSEAEVIGLVAPRISIACEAGELTLGETNWVAGYVGDGVWRVAIICGTVSEFFSELYLSGALAPLWSFREASERIIPLNDRAREIQIRPAR